MQGHVQVKALKVNVVVPADQLPPLPEGDQVILVLATPDKLFVRARLNPKSYRRALATIAQHGAENIAVLVQGQMSKAGELESVGLSAVVKTPKAAEPGTEGETQAGLATSHRAAPAGDGPSQQGIRAVYPVRTMSFGIDLVSHNLLYVMLTNFAFPVRVPFAVYISLCALYNMWT